ncbi:DUF421 domain-containing protein [Negadavirga shengliensis]|uniref:DUF421 domain-containing protein n=1 Tax=Negadavirga shengliensis TaxID=1389218 RepID=A0ABV9T3W0_9BACT
MEEYPIHLDDIQRIIIGEANFDFYIEIIFRIAFIYFLLMSSMRLLGQRMASQLSRIEMAAMVSLAAAIGVPLQTPERGLLPAAVIAVVVVSVTRMITLWAAKSQKFETYSQGDMAILVEDGVLRYKSMKKSRVTRERLFAELRSQGLTHLGEVKRLYFEANGSFSLIINDTPMPGLSIIPEWDEDFKKEQQTTELIICGNCGYKENNRHAQLKKCVHCGANAWNQGVL